MTDLRDDDFKHADPPATEDVGVRRWPADGSGDEFDGGYDPTATGERIADANGDELEHGQPDLPDRVVVGANGAYWRDYGTHYSMCPVSDDNDPVDPVAVYVRVIPVTEEVVPHG